MSGLIASAKPYRIKAAHRRRRRAAVGLFVQRYYDPLIGRFLSVDPVTAYGSGDMRHFNRYVYAFNNPYKFTDPDGRQSAIGRIMERIMPPPPSTPEGQRNGRSDSRGSESDDDGGRRSGRDSTRHGREVGRSTRDVRVGTEGATDTKRKSQESYTVRVQAQGTALRSEASIPLSSAEPIPATAVQVALAGTQAQLGRSDQAALAPAFAKASQWVDRVAASGGVGPIGSTSFNVRGVSGSEMRVDVEVLRGPVNIVE